MIRAALLLLLTSAPLAAQNSAAEQARAAADDIEAATRMLDAAEGAGDRVRALTETIQAFERGLGALRDGLRQAAFNETQLRTQLQAHDAEVAQLLGALQTIGAADGPTALLHPAGPLGTVRAGMLLSELTPALDRRAAALREDLENLRTLRALQDDAATRLREGLSQVRSAREDLNRAMAERTDLPLRFTADPIRTAILIASTETLDGFASGLSEIITEEVSPAPTALEGDIGNLPLPVRGTVLRAAGEADAAGVTRPGIIVATSPQAIVTSPTAATLRYAGPLLDLGNVVILEPQAQTLFVLAGLDVIYGEAGQVIAAGAPLGLMGGTMPERATDVGGALSPLREGSGTERSETLYIEVRRDNVPQDPAKWFRTDKDE